MVNGCDRGYQYTSKTFGHKLKESKMIQSMSRTGRCIDNGPIERFWGTLKTEMQNLKKFNTYEELKNSLKEYINYYDTKKYQKRLNSMTPTSIDNILRKCKT